MTADQALEIVKLITANDQIVNPEFTFQKYDPSWYEDAAELVRIIFSIDDIILEGRKFMVEIYDNLSVFAYIQKEEPRDGYEPIKCWHNLPTQNQYEIQEKFREWKVIPSEKNKRIKLKNMVA